VNLVKWNRTIENYSGLTITGRVKPYLGTWIPGNDAVVGFDRSTWDGSDLFVVENWRRIFVTKKVMLAVEDSDVRGLYFYPIEPKGTIIDIDSFSNRLEAEGRLK
jgi:hypothetical protein